MCNTFIALKTLTKNQWQMVRLNAIRISVWAGRWPGRRRETHAKLGMILAICQYSTETRKSTLSTSSSEGKSKSIKRSPLFDVCIRIPVQPTHTTKIETQIFAENAKKTRKEIVSIKTVFCPKLDFIEVIEFCALKIFCAEFYCLQLFFSSSNLCGVISIN